MGNIRMPDGTVIRGVPDGVSKDDFNSHLVEKYGQDKFDSMTAAGGKTSEWGEKVIAARDKPADPYQPPIPEVDDGQTWKEEASDLRHANDQPSKFEDSITEHSLNSYRMKTTIENEDGSTSSVRSMSVEDERLNEGKPTLIPSIWDGEELDPVTATDRAVSSGAQWPSYETNEQATAASKRISSGLADRASEDKAQRKLRDEQNLYMLNMRKMPSMSGSSDLSKSKPERLEAMGRRMETLIEKGIRTPEDYYVNQEEIDVVMFDKFAHDQQMLQEDEEAAIAAGVLPNDPEKSSNFAPSKWNHLKVQFMSFITGEDFARQKELPKASQATQSKQYEALAMLYMDRAAETWKDLKPVQKEILDDAAERLGLTGDQYYKMTGTMISQAVEYEHAASEGVQRWQDDMNRFRPEKEFGKDPFEYIAIAATDNLRSMGYMTVGMLTRNPHIAAVLMSTDMYQRKFTESRMDGKSIGESSADGGVYAMLELVLEGLPIHRILALTKAGNKAGARKLLDAAVIESGQEMVTEGLQMGYDWGVYGDKVTVAQALSQLRDSGILGALFGSVIIAPHAIAGDHHMNVMNQDISNAKKKLQSVATRVMDPSNKGTDATKAEAAEATKEYAAAVKKKRSLVKERKEAEAEKKKAKTEKKETKRKAKRTPAQAKQEETQQKRQEADKDPLLAEALQNVADHELKDLSMKEVDSLLDIGYIKKTSAGALVVLPAGKRRLKAVRAEQEAADDVQAIEVVTFETEATKKKQAGIDAEIGRLIRDEQPITPKPYTSPENRQAQLEQKIRKSVTEPAAREKIATAIIKAEQEEEAYAQHEAEQAATASEAWSKQYREAIDQMKEVGAEVALNLAQLEQKGVSGKFTTRLGDVFREAEKKLKAAADKARSEMDDKFWSKPQQGQLFDITGILVKGSAEYAKAVKVGAYKLAQHGSKYASWAADMVGEFGESIKPALAKLYQDAKKNVSNVLKWSHEKFGKDHHRRGELKHAPKQYAKPGAIKRLRMVLEKLAGEGKGARKWYERSGKAILKATSDMAEARMFAGVLAIYSRATGVGPNLTNALKMWAIYKSGKIPAKRQGTMAGRFSGQDEQAIAWLKGNMDDTEFIGVNGDKVGAFFTNLMRSIDPKTYEFGQGVTVDIWMMRALGYDTSNPTDAQYAFASIELRQLAEKLGWERQQVQAAVWVAMKSRWGLILHRAQARAVKEGLAELNKLQKGKVAFDVFGATRADQVANEKKIVLIFREEALKATVTEMTERMKVSRKDFSDFLESQYATISWEAEPSTSLGLIFNSMPIEDKVLLQYEISQVLTNPETGREYLAEWLGLLGDDQFQGPGAWDGAVGAVTQTGVLAPLQHKRSEAKHKVKTVQPQSAQALDGYSAILGFLLKQDAVAWHRPFYGNAKKRANGISIQIQENMDAGKLSRLVTRLYAAIIAEAQTEGWNGMDWAPIALNGEIRILNFSEYIGNNEFHEIIRKAADKAKVGAGNLEVFQTDGNMISNDWVEFPAGEQYEQAINSSENKRVKKAFERAKRELAKRIDAVYESYAEKYKAKQRAAPRVTIRTEGRAEPKQLKGTRRFRIFRKGKYSALKTEFFGQGIRGAEKKRGSMPVISAYPDKGFKKEVGLGNVEYIVDVKEETLYDANNDPLGFKEKADYEGRLDFNKYESLIKGAGYVGYYTPTAKGNLKGQARFFADLTVGQAGLTSQLMVPEKPVIRIKENEMDEFEVLEQNGEIYYTTDMDDAMGTARKIYGENSVVEFVDEYGDIISTHQPVPKTVKIRLEDKRAEYYEARQATAEGRAEFAGSFLSEVEAKKQTKNALADIQSSVNEFVEEFEEETMENPLVRGERILGKGSAIELGSRGGMIWIDSIRSFEQGTGQGNEALKFIIELADKHGVRLKLFAKPYAEGLDQRSLIAWYRKNGFVSEYLEHTMIRHPSNVTHQFAMWKRPKVLTNAFMGMDLYETEQWAQKFADELGIGNIQVVESAEGLPNDLWENIALNGFSGLVQGAFHDDIIDGPTIYIIANNLTEVWTEGVLTQTMLMKLREVVMHEALGHFGLQAFLGPKKFNQFVDAIRREFPKDVEYRRREGKMGKGVESQRLAAEEVFAYWVQDKMAKKDIGRKKMGFIERLIFDLKLILAKWGWTQQEMSEDYFDRILSRVLYFTRGHTTEQLQKRAHLVRRQRDAAYAIERAEGTFSLKQDPLLDSFDEKAGNVPLSKLEGLRAFRDKWIFNLRRNFEIHITDQFAGILHAEKDIGMEFGPTSGYMSVRLSAGVDVIIRSAMDNAVPVWHKEEDGSRSVKMDDTVLGLTQILAPISSKVLLRDFQRFLVANRARRLIKVGKEKNLTRDEIAATLNYIRKSGNMKLFQQVNAEMQEFKGKILDFAQEAGLIDPVSRKLWEKNDHIPFYRVLAANDKNGAFARLGSVGKVIHQQKGSKLALKPALENIFDNISMLIEASVKNAAMQDVINQFDGSGLVTKVPAIQVSTALIPMEKIRDMLNDAGVALDEVGNELLSGVQRLMSIQATQEEDNIVSVQENGKKKFYYVHDEGVMKGMENVKAEQHGWVMRILRAPKRLITTIITRFPGFILANWFRDMLHSTILVRFGVFTPLDSAAGWAEAIFHSKTFKELMAGGGMFDSGYINTNDPKTTTKAMRKKLMARGRGNILDSPAKLARAYIRIANGAENAARVMIFKKALKKTGSRKQALYEARDIMDFSVRGASPIMQFFIETVPFLGARWQGISRTKRGAMQNPMLVATRGFMVTLATWALYLMNRDDERYKSLLEYDRHMYYHFFDVFEEGDHYRLPKPFEVGAMFSTIPEIGLEYMLSKEPDRGDTASEALWWVLMEQFNMAPMVQIAAPVVELAMNKNFFTDAPIEHYWESQLDASRRYGDRTNKTITWLAQHMPDNFPDAARSPKQLEFLLKRYFATAADYAFGISDRMFFSEQMPTPRWDEKVGFQRFKREAYPKFDIYQQAMYDTLNAADQIYYTILDLKKDRTPQARKELQEIREREKALLWARKRMASTIKKIQEINKKIRRIHASNKTPDEKREQIDKFVGRKREAAKRMYDFRPGGKKNPYGREGKGEVEQYMPDLINDLIGKTKKEQVDTLIAAELPHTATLINDVMISVEKLRRVA